MARGEALHSVQHSRLSAPKMQDADNKGMVLIEPSDDDECVAVVLRQLDTILRSSRPTLDQLIVLGKTNSVRRIQAGRYEIFLKARDKDSTAFDQLLADNNNKLPSDTKERLLRYARAQAQKDPRLANQEYDFGNFSIIVNFEGVQAQERHIDLLLPNWQFGLVVTDKVPPTLAAESSGHVQTVEDLEPLWQESSTSVATAVSRKVFQTMRQDKEVASLLQECGDLMMAPTDLPLTQANQQLLRTGSLLSLPGGIVHAGPESHDFRAIIFFSASPKDVKVAPYHPDTQYTPVLLCGHIVSLLWRKVGIEFPHRLFLLQQLVKYIAQGTVKSMGKHLPEGKLADFIETVDLGNYPNGSSKDEYIQAGAEEDTLCDWINDIVVDIAEGGTVAVANFEKVSVDGLHTAWDGKSFPLIVFQSRVNGKIILNYPTETDPVTGTLSWEGKDSNDAYRLCMRKDVTNERFDGTNGNLYTTDGQDIKCWVPEPSLRAESEASSALHPSKRQKMKAKLEA